MLKIDVYRDGVIQFGKTVVDYGPDRNEFHVPTISATFEWRINEPCKFTFTCPYGVRDGDVVSLTCLDARGTHSLGKFDVIVVEPKHDGGTTQYKVTCVDQQSYKLMMQASPGSPFLDGVNITTGISQITQFTLLDTGQTVVINPVNAPAAGSGVIKSPGGNKMLDKLKALLTATGSCYRPRPDVSSDLIEYGVFGEVAQTRISTRTGMGMPDGDLDNSALFFEYSTAAAMFSSADRFNCAFAEGGTYGPENKDYIDMFGQLAPDGYVVQGVTINGKTYARMCKTKDEFGNPFPFKRSIFVSVGSLAATRDVKGTLSQDNVEAARAEIARRVAQLLEEISRVSITINPEIPQTVFGVLVPGNQVPVSFCDEEYGTINRNFYVGGFQTEWNDDGSVRTNLELSTKLEKLSDPIQSYFETASNPPAPPIITTSAYIVEIQIGPTCQASYSYPATYSIPPQLTVSGAGGCAFVIVSNTTSGFTISSSPCSPACQSAFVTIVPP